MSDEVADAHRHPPLEMNPRGAPEVDSKGRPVQPGVSRADLAKFAQTDKAQRLALLEADEALMLRLSVEGFGGRAWDQVSNALVEYGWQVMRAWIVTGQVFVKLKEKGQPFPPPPANGIPREHALELAENVVADAIVHFRDHVLKTGKWNPARGANLTTFFIGNCLRYQFPKLYKAWLEELRRSRTRSDLPTDDHLPATADEFADPAQQIIATDTSDRAVSTLLGLVPDPTNRAILQLRAQDYDIDEIAEMLDLEYKAVESRLYRTRQKIRTATSKEAS